MHQLVFELNRQGVDAQMVYVAVHNPQEAIHSEFRQYINSWIPFNKIEDEEGNLVVLGETLTKYCYKLKHSCIALWWLSVDNYLRQCYGTEYFRSIGGVSFKNTIQYLRSFTWKHIFRKLFFIRRKIDINLVQSYYAQLFAQQHTLSNIEYLSDYINDIYILPEEEILKRARKDIILYNPNKGSEIVEILREQSKYTWIPLIGLSNREMKNRLETAKVYVDFGYHPGKDRIPREAAISGCCIITGRRGSAANDVDINIPEIYKFHDSPKECKNISECINACIVDYSTRSKDFYEYREKIRGEKKRFEDDVFRLFVRE